MDLDTLKVLGSGLFALLAAALGATTAMFVQRRAMRIERDRLTHAARGRVNALSVAVFRDFLRAAKPVERIAERRQAGESIPDDEVYASTNEMYLRWQEVSVFCDAAISANGIDFINALQEVVWHRPTLNSVSKTLEQSRIKLYSIAGPIFREEI